MHLASDHAKSMEIVWSSPGEEEVSRPFWRIRTVNSVAALIPRSAWEDLSAALVPTQESYIPTHVTCGMYLVYTADNTVAWCVHFSQLLWHLLRYWPCAFTSVHQINQIFCGKCTDHGFVRHFVHLIVRCYLTKAKTSKRIRL